MPTPQHIIDKDCQVIDTLGGPAKVAKLLKFNPKNGAQRVHGWRVRGIPSWALLEHKIFLRMRKKL